MAKDTQVQIRLSQELKEKLKLKGNMSGYIHGLIEKDLGLNEETLDPFSERGKAAVREAVKQGEYEVEVQAGSSAPVAEPVFKESPPIHREVQLKTLITQLKGQGMTTRVATQEAKRRLGL